MDVKMEEVEDKICVFEDSLEIDFDYEFDVAKFYDFTKIETPEEILEYELWFELSGGHPPSPLIMKFDKGADDLDSVTSSTRYESHDAYSTDNDSGEFEVSSIEQAKKGRLFLRSKSMPTSQPIFSVSSRLLQPTASLLAKQNQQIGVCSTRVLRRLQKLGNPIKSPEEIEATKRQKLEIGYLLKVAQLKHQTSFSHKSSKKVGTTDINPSHGKPKVTVPKEPDLATARRALRHRSKNGPHLSCDAEYNVSSIRARPLNGKIQETQYSSQAVNKTSLLPQFQDGNIRRGKVANSSGMLNLRRTNSIKVLAQEKSDQDYNFRDHPSNKKIFSSEGDIGVFRNRNRGTTVPKEFKLSNSKKLSQNPPAELFSKLTLNPEIHSTLRLEERPVQIKVLKKAVSFSNMKENKNANAVTRKSMRCSGNGGRMIREIGNHLPSVRSFKIH
ncbi:hypothetical protein BVRB_3g067560 [Beta vulgaris subsp. vulgaris]|uniref:TPX2 central domain-containing protein n=1 Tax=Beta vulgaris subsp. vulgaris TaxID=3555 RepID=A0A0J8BDI0_BETVV|nr:hypothetical protein BVRB_3g067560 [Beta vulgaris subsp. vulgaris]